MGKIGIKIRKLAQMRNIILLQNIPLLVDEVRQKNNVVGEFIVTLSKADNEDA